MIRSYMRADGRYLAAIHNTVFPNSRHTPLSFGEFVAGTKALGGSVWIIEDSVIAGYGSVTPVPGLSGLAELDGCIATDRQRQGLGSALLTSMLQNLKGSTISQVAYGVEKIASPTALFFEKHHFFVEHEEWILAYFAGTKMAQWGRPDKVTIKTFTRNTAVTQFCNLYQKSFSGLPWDQPYSVDEVQDTLDYAADLQFLMLDGEAIGFAWTKLDAQGRGVIEPLGIIPPYQNRGYGRYLLTSTMRLLLNKGAKRIEIGAWRSNERAVELYRSVGYQHVKTITYLAYNLSE